jgi:hypothetical protein
MIQNIMLFQAFSSPLHRSKKFKIINLITKSCSRYIEMCPTNLVIKRCPPPFLAVVLMLYGQKMLYTRNRM